LLVRDHGVATLRFSGPYLSKGGALGNALFRDYSARSDQAVHDALQKMRHDQQDH
jgi:hypothetical protein